MSRLDLNSVPGLDPALLHGFSGCAISLIIAHYGGTLRGTLITLAIAFGKEAFEALGIAPWEPKQTWHNSMIDFLWFAVGIAVALVVELT